MAENRVARGRVVCAGCVLWWLSVACAVSMAASASGPGTLPGPRSTAAESLEDRIAAGDLRYRDPETREVVTATAERVAELRRDLAPLFERPAVAPLEVRPDGTVVVDTDGFVGHVHLRRVDLDGGVSVACVDTLDAAVAFILGLHGPGMGPRGSALRAAVTE